MKIRRYRPEDAESLEAVTDSCFGGVSIDYGMERLFGPIAEKTWQWRKRREIRDDIRANSAGIFVAEEDGAVVGYVTTRIDREAGMGRIANLAVLPGSRRQGTGRRLIEAAERYVSEEGMAYLRIETLAHNEVGTRFYPKMGFREIARQVHFIKRIGNVVADDTTAGETPER